MLSEDPKAMRITLPYHRLAEIQLKKVILVVGIMASLVFLKHLITFPYENYVSILPSPVMGMPMTMHTTSFLSTSISVNDNLDEEATFRRGGEIEDNLDEEAMIRKGGEKEDEDSDIASYGDRDEDEDGNAEAETTRLGGDQNLENSVTEVPIAAELSLVSNEKQALESKHDGIEHPVSATSDDVKMVADSVMREKRLKLKSISYMTSILQNAVSATPRRSKASSARDKELQRARREIENAPRLQSTQGLHAPIYRNISMFIRSYELMEEMLKVYVYREGEKPIFHQPKQRGIYSSEGWFMKLMEGNKKFTVKNPKKAHLFYLPFSSLKLRSMLNEQNITKPRHLEQLLENYIDMISRRYRSWNRVSGADHFLVACHDWAPKLTRNRLGRCIRALCNSNLASGFRIGQDVTLPVTNIRYAGDPTRFLGGNPPEDRHILAFFAGGMHGSLRPILLQHWNNKEPDMKIFGQLSRDANESKTMFREFMQSSKYCICARGYEVHTPRVVESIYYECVPVIISDNYVPPFFEVLDWESFAVFVSERDVPNLRNILLSIPEERYLEMQQKVKMVQQHFLWHKKPEKYDLFHMILHSIWYSRVFSI